MEFGSNWDIMYGVVWPKEGWNIMRYKRHLIHIDKGDLIHNLKFYMLIGTFFLVLILCSEGHMKLEHTVIYPQ